MTDSLLIFLVELTVWNPTLQRTDVLRYASGQGFVTAPSDSPANTFYEARVDQAALLSRDIFDKGTLSGESRVGYGDLVLANGDGGLDGFLYYGVDGWPITIKLGSPTAAFSTFTTVLQGTMRIAQVGQQSVTVKLRDRQGEIEKPLQTTKYLGNNVAPGGVEGSADLKGKGKPLCFGRILNAPAVCVNAPKQVYQVKDGSIQSLDAVYDRGVPLTGGYLSLSDRSPASPPIYDMAYAPEIKTWVACGAGNNIQRSTDAGITWTSINHGLGTNPLYTICWDPVMSLFIMMGTTSGFYGISSDGGLTWTKLAIPSPFGTTNEVYWMRSDGRGTVIAVGGGGTIGRTTDGINWTFPVSGFGATNIRGCSPGAPLMWCIVGDTGKIATSSDGGQSFTLQTSGIAGAIYGVAYRKGIFAAAADADAAVLISDDNGASWVKRTIVGIPPGGASPVGYRLVGSVGDAFIMSAEDITGLNIISDVTGRTWEYMPRWTATGKWNAAYGDGVVVFGAWNGVGPTGKVIHSSINGGTYASLTDLLDDTQAPKAGTWKAYLAGGLFRLGGSGPAGLITADVTEDIIGNRTVAQLFRKVLERAGYTASDYSSSDLAALDAVQPAECGWWGQAETNINAVLDELAASAGAWWGIDRTGVFRIQQVAEAGSAYVIAWTDNDVLLGSLTQLPPADDNNGLPTYRSVLQYAKNYAVQASDVAGSVSNDRRVFLAQQWRTVESNDASVPTAHKLSPQVTEDSLILNQTDAQGEVSRRQKIRGRRQDRFELTVLFDAINGAVDLFQSVLLTHSRFGLSGGRLFRVIGLQPDGASQKLRVRLWAAAATSDVIPSDISGGRGIIPPGSSFLRGPRGQRVRRILA